MPLIPEGQYLAVAEPVEPGKLLGESTKSNTPAIKFTVKIIEKGEYNGIRLPWEGWLTESAGERSIEQAQIAGATFPEDKETGEPDIRNPEGIGSTQFMIGVEVEEYTPEKTDANPNPRPTKRNRTTFISRVGESRLKEMDADRQTMIARQFGGTVMLVRKKREERLAGKAPAGGNGTDFDTAGMDAAAAAEKAAEEAKKKAAEKTAADKTSGGGKAGGGTAKAKSY